MNSFDLEFFKLPVQKPVLPGQKPSSVQFSSNLYRERLTFFTEFIDFSYFSLSFFLLQGLRGGGQGECPGARAELRSPKEVQGFQVVRVED